MSPVAAAVATTPSVFLSFTEPDRAFAQQVADVLFRSGVRVWTVDDVSSRGDYSDRVRRALHTSNAIVVALGGVANRRELPASVLFEIGAAAGAGKPIFVVVDEATSKLPFGVSDLHLIPASRIEEIPRFIKEAARSVDQR